MGNFRPSATRTFGILTAGGDCPGLNAVLAASHYDAGLDRLEELSPAGEQISVPPGRKAVNLLI